MGVPAVAAVVCFASGHGLKDGDGDYAGTGLSDEFVRALGSMN